MNRLNAIWTSFEVTHGALQGKRDGARSARSSARWDSLILLNEQAYYLKLFAEVEARVDSLCERLFQRRSAPRVRGRNGRIWQISSQLHDSGRLPFMDRIAILIDRGSAEYRDLGKPYKLRCDLAHGDPSVTAILLSTKYWDLRRLTRSLRIS